MGVIHATGCLSAERSRAHVVNRWFDARPRRAHKGLSWLSLQGIRMPNVSPCQEDKYHVLVLLAAKWSKSEFRSKDVYAV